MYRILPCLTKEFVNPTMVPFVLQNVLLIAENCTPKDFTKNILPSLRPVMKIQEPIQILLIFMQKMELVLKLTPPEDVKLDVLPMLYRALESDAQQIQELCLSVLPTFASLIDYPAMKNALLPRIKKLCINTPHVSVKVNCLLCIGKLLEHLDKWLVLDEIVPFLPQIPSREPAVLMGILGIYKLALTHNKLGLTKEVMANKVIPFLVPLCIENGLTLNQFNALVSLVKEMINRVEAEHKTKLEQLNPIHQERREMEANIQSMSNSIVSSVPSLPNNEFEAMFSSLGIDSYSVKSQVTSSETQNIKPMPSIPKPNSLSLEDKKRMVKEQEQVQRLQTQSTIVPKPVIAKPTPQPKDLTSTLIENQLKQINITSQQSNWNNDNFTSNSNNINNNFGAVQPTQNSNWSNFSSTTPSSQQPNNWPSSPPASTTNSMNNWNGFNQWSSNQSASTTTQQQNSTQNWSAFDSLLPNNNSKPSKVPLNQMQSTNPLKQSLLMPQSGGTQHKAANVLSAEDIMDFLNN